MKRIEYKITFFTYWQCGSGLSSGADADTLVVKDADNLPFIPGKTLKGLLRQAVEELHDLDTSNKLDAKVIESCFGLKQANNVNVDGNYICPQGSAFFSNAELDKNLQAAIIKEGLQSQLYSNIASTAIDSATGIAKDNSLRTMEVCVPCTLKAYIDGIPDEMEGLMINAMKYIKRMGVNRNRGLGRCCIEKI